jgi:asparagine synthase (glutamine-hydrolysing)
MCGIWSVLGKPYDDESIAYYLSQLKARGPEASQSSSGDGFQLGFTRLAINGLNASGMQPMTTGSLTWACNGEIYNWRNLAERYSIESKSGSDCEVLGPLFQKLATSTDVKTFFRSLDGVFATVIVDSAAGLAFIARDPYGVRPLFVGYCLEGAGTDANGAQNTNKASLVDSSGKRRAVSRIVFASEMKALPLNECAAVEPFPPGHYAVYNLKTLQRIGFESYHTVPFLQNPTLSLADALLVRNSLEAAVEKRMMTERPVSALLSGGLDSSLIAALVQKRLKAAGAQPLKTFSIGFEGSEDLKYARIVADHIGSEHHEIVRTPDDFFAMIPNVIRDIESFDVTTVRASVGNWLVSKEIAKRTDCKVVFNGDGSDEVFGGYMYFYKAPSDEAFEAESGRLLEDIHLFDVLRSDRSISSHGLEARTPFLDKQFVALARSFPTACRRPIIGKQVEKALLREAFASEGLLPDSVLYRKKEAFSDGVSGKFRPWYQLCQEYALEEVGPNWESKAAKFTHLTPKTAEAYYYRFLFDKLYGQCERAVVPYPWMPKWTPGVTDPSARTLDVYKEVA